MQTKIGAISQLGAEKITFPPKPDGHTDRRTDICFYRVALLLKTKQQIMKISSAATKKEKDST